MYNVYVSESLTARRACKPEPRGLRGHEMRLDVLRCSVFGLDVHARTFMRGGVHSAARAGVYGA